MGGAAATRRGMHYGIDLIVNFLPVKARTLADIFVRLVVTGVAGILTYLSYLLCINLNGKIFTATGISYLALDLAPLLGFALMTVYSTIFLVKDLKKTAVVFGGKDKEAAK